MSQKIIVGSKGLALTLTDRDYVAAGGEAAVFKKDNIAYRIYHKPTDMIPLDKIKELMLVTSPNVNKPLDIIYEPKTSLPLGFTMEFLEKTHPLCKLFTGSFKDDNGIDPMMTAALVKKLQSTVSEVHKDRFLIVDLNEMNVLVSDDFTTPYFIDVGSWQTPSFPATAIMESIRDPLVKNMKFTEGSDWFSWSILAFQLYTHVHPYKGRHPNYKLSEWRRRMDDGVSVFANGATVPSFCNSFSVIPKRHLDWFKAVYTKNERSEPPLPDSTAAVALPPQVVTLRTSSRFTISEVHNYGTDIISVHYLYGVEYTITKKGIYINRGNHKFPLTAKNPKEMVCESDTPNSPVFAYSDGGNDMVFRTGYSVIGDAAINNGYFYRNGAIYTVAHGTMVENTFTTMGSNIGLRATVVENVSELTTKVFDGLVLQDLFGKAWLSVPYDKGRCLSKHIKEMDGFRILDAKGVKNFCVVVGEKKGKYHRFIIIFDSEYRQYTVREVPDINYDGINFTVSPGGVGVLLSNDSEVELFRDNTNINVITDPPFDAKMKLFCAPDGVHFINGTSIFKVTMK